MLVVPSPFNCFKGPFKVTLLHIEPFGHGLFFWTWWYHCLRTLLIYGGHISHLVALFLVAWDFAMLGSFHQLPHTPWLLSSIYHLLNNQLFQFSTSWPYPLPPCGFLTGKSVEMTRLSKFFLHGPTLLFPLAHSGWYVEVSSWVLDKRFFYFVADWTFYLSPSFS